MLLIGADHCAYRRTRLFWLWFGFALSLCYLGTALLFDPATALREMIHTTPILDALCDDVKSAAHRTAETAKSKLGQSA